MDHAATMRRAYDLINAGDVDGFGDLIAGDFVEHEELPGLAPTKEGVKDFFQMYLAAFPDLRMDAEDVLASGDKVVARGLPGRTRASSSAFRRRARASTSNSSTSSASGTTVWPTSIGVSSTR